MLSLDFTVYFLFTFHTILLAVKMWALYYFAKLLVFEEAPGTGRVMILLKRFDAFIIIYTFLMVLFEAYYFVNFFVDMEMYLYEYASMFDQVFFTFLAVLYLKREGKSHG